VGNTQIEYTPEAIDDLKLFKKYEQQSIFDQVDEQLLYEPTLETRSRKKLRPNSVAEYELRIGKFRVFYDVDRKFCATRCDSVENGIKTKNFGSCGGRQLPPGSLSTLPAKTLCSLNFNNQPSESRLTWAET
jgi:mRNA-degrading endonuclease RelE of RelBE toxin-antitoxin system